MNLHVKMKPITIYTNDLKDSIGDIHIHPESVCQYDNETYPNKILTQSLLYQYNQYELKPITELDLLTSNDNALILNPSYLKDGGVITSREENEEFIMWKAPKSNISITFEESKLLEKTYSNFFNNENELTDFRSDLREYVKFAIHGFERYCNEGDKLNSAPIVATAPFIAQSLPKNITRVLLVLPRYLSLKDDSMLCDYFNHFFDISPKMFGLELEGREIEDIVVLELPIVDEAIAYQIINSSLDVYGYTF